MSDYEFTMSLGIRHPHIDPAEITRGLGLQPRHAWCKGEERLDPSGTALGGAYRESYWFCELTPRREFSGKRAGVESELVRILDALRSSAGFMQELHNGGGVTELFVSIFVRGDTRIELLAKEAAVLGRLGIAMTIEIKPYPGPSVTRASN